MMSAEISYADGKQLIIRKHLLKYTQENFTFRFYATCIAPRDASRLPTDSLTLVMAHGLGLNVETYFPAIQHLYALQDKPVSPVRIRAIWIVDHANHSDSAPLNEEILRKHYSGLFPIQYYGHGIVTFMKSGLVNIDDPYLIPIAHCGGSGALVLAVDTLLRYHRLQVRCMILLEPILFDRRVESHFIEFTNRVHKYNKKREHIWQNVDEAMSYHLKRPPWRAWDREVLRWTSREAFRTVPNTESPKDKPWVVFKTPIPQETASFETEGPLISAGILLELIPRMPVHIIMAAKKNMWSKSMCDNQTELIEKHEPLLASYKVVPKAGHCAPQDNPSGTAVAIFETLLQEHKEHKRFLATHAEPMMTSRL